MFTYVVLYGCMAAWLYGCMAVWLYRRASYLQGPKLDFVFIRLFIGRLINTYVRSGWILGERRYQMSLSCHAVTALLVVYRLLCKLLTFI